MDYYGLMVQIHRFRVVALAVALALQAHVSWAQTPAEPEPAAAALPSEAEDASDDQAAVDAELFYELLVGELTTSYGDPASGYALMLDAVTSPGRSPMSRRTTFGTRISPTALMIPTRP